MEALDSTSRYMDRFDRIDVVITTAPWDRPYGEGCRRPPVAALLVTRSPLKPAVS